MKSLLLAGVAVAAYAFVTPALADSGPSGSIGGGYAYVNSSGGGGHINDWNVDGSINVPFGSTHLSGQVDGEYHGFSGSGADFHDSKIDGAIMWNDPRGRLGAAVGQTTLGGSGSSFHLNNYGVFGVYYPSNRWTVGLKGGRMSANHSHANYYGEELIGYVNPNLALSLTGDQFTPSGSHLNTWGLGGEYQPTSRPWTVSAKYEYSSISGFSGHLNTIGVRLKWYFGGGGTLVQHHRDGPETFGTKQTAFNLLF